MRIKIPLPGRGGETSKGPNPILGTYLIRSRDLPHEGFSLGKFGVFYRGTTDDGLTRYEIKAITGKVTAEDIATIGQFLIALANNNEDVEIYREINDGLIIMGLIALALLTWLIIRGLIK